MTDDSNNKSTRNKHNEIIFNIRDVSDFYQKWPELRDFAVEITTKSSALTKYEKQLIEWFIILMDRISKDDIENR